MSDNEQTESLFTPERISKLSEKACRLLGYHTSLVDALTARAAAFATPQRRDPSPRTTAQLLTEAATATQLLTEATAALVDLQEEARQLTQSLADARAAYDALATSALLADAVRAEREACARLVKFEIEVAKNNNDDTKYLGWALKHIEERGVSKAAAR